MIHFLTLWPNYDSYQLTATGVVGVAGQPAVPPVATGLEHEPTGVCLPRINPTVRIVLGQMTTQRPASRDCVLVWYTCISILCQVAKAIQSYYHRQLRYGMVFSA